MSKREYLPFDRGRGRHDHFVLNTKTSRIEFVEPEAYARKLRLLGDWEEVTPPGQ